MRKRNILGILTVLAENGVVGVEREVNDGRVCYHVQVNLIYARMKARLKQDMGR